MGPATTPIRSRGTVISFHNKLRKLDKNFRGSFISDYTVTGSECVSETETDAIPPEASRRDEPEERPPVKGDLERNFAKDILKTELSTDTETKAAVIGICTIESKVCCRSCIEIERTNGSDAEVISSSYVEVAG